MKSLSDWLLWIERQHPQEIELGLERVATVASRLAFQLPPVVTVAGTNGKGSCVSLLSNIVAGARYRVGSYTSPHLFTYNERIAINGQPVSDGLICAAFEEIARVQRDISLSYFEYGTLAALLIFRDAELDLIVLEVGLGGRLDAVNIVDPAVAIISSIALDHEDWLGNDRETIGREKAGILRRDRPVVIGEGDVPRSVLACVEEVGARAYIINEHFGPLIGGASWCWRGLDQRGEPLRIAELPLPNIVLSNAAAVLQAIQFLPLDINIEAVIDGLRITAPAGRCQHLEYKGVDVVFDVAHNPAAVLQLSAHIKGCDPSPTTAGIFAAMRDKAVADIQGIMKTDINNWFLADVAANKRAMPASEAASLLRDQGVERISICKSLSTCFDDAIDELEKGDRLLVFGSFLTVAEVVSHVHNKNIAMRDSGKQELQ